MAAFNPAAFDNAAFNTQALVGGAFDAAAFDNDGFYTAGAAAPVTPGFDANAFDAGGFWTGGTVTPPAPQPQPGGVGLGGPTRRKARRPGQTDEERDAAQRRERAEFFAQIERAAADEAGLNGRAPGGSARETDSAGGASYSLHASTLAKGTEGTPDAADGFHAFGAADPFSRALLARLLAAPVDKIGLPVQPFPHVISAGRVAAIEAARLRAVHIRDEDEAVAALLMAGIL
jgi:hypothetical protein